MDDGHGRGRFVAALVTAPVVGIAALTLGAGLVLAAAGEYGVAPAGFVHAFRFLLLFGAPAAYLAEVVVALPLFRYLNRRRLLRPLRVIGAAALVGGLVFTLTWSAFWGAWRLDFAASGMALGAWAGCVGGAWFWMVAFAGAPSARAARWQTV
jgi:hypothetical protein